MPKPTPRTLSPDELGMVTNMGPIIRRCREHLRGCPMSMADRDAVDLIDAIHLFLDDVDLSRPLSRERVQVFIELFAELDEWTEKHLAVCPGAA